MRSALNGGEIEMVFLLAKDCYLSTQSTEVVITILLYFPINSHLPSQWLNQS